MILLTTTELPNTECYMKYLQLLDFHSVA